MAFRTNKVPDLQEKSASGAVASFNTALAMPLASCNIAVNAYQEGSGEPSPVNNRPIHGFSVVNIGHTGKNLLNGLSGSGATVDITYDNIMGEYTLNGTASGNYLYVVDLPCELPVGAFCVSAINNITSDVIIRLQTSDSTTIRTFNLNTLNPYISFTTDRHISRYVIRLNGGTNYDNYKFKLQLELGSTPAAYEPYVTPTIYTIQLGQEVYGAEVDVVNGVAHCTHGIKIYNGLENWSDSVVQTFPCFITPKQSGIANRANFISNIITVVVGFYNDPDNVGFYGGSNFNVICKQFANANAFSEYLQNNPMVTVYELTEPFDIQLTPTQIETLIGNNTIFADTGDISLTYKDLDIAKRGNFREVFRLPS